MNIHSGSETKRIYMTVFERRKRKASRTEGQREKARKREGGKDGERQEEKEGGGGRY